MGCVNSTPKADEPPRGSVHGGTAPSNGLKAEPLAKTPRTSGAEAKEAKEPEPKALPAVEKEAGAESTSNHGGNADFQALRKRFLKGATVGSIHSNYKIGHTLGGPTRSTLVICIIFCH